ncbi:MAG: hypothetical protein HC881_13485 [Leptolyngbyaceae cyanobacterium SL_7_1]|nr:hypothetical protein [Leptolyngbyaceae cyanobacterium SL_7_1]
MQKPTPTTPAKPVNGKAHLQLSRNISIGASLEFLWCHVKLEKQLMGHHGQLLFRRGTTGQNHGWRYLVGIAISLFFWLGLGTIATVSFIVGWSILHPSSAIATPEQIQVFLQTPSVAAYVASNIPSVFFLLGIFLTMRLVHQRRFVSLISVQGTVLPKRILLSFAVWFGLLALPSIADYWLNPQNFMPIPTPSEWWFFYRWRSSSPRCKPRRRSSSFALTCCKGWD